MTKLSVNINKIATLRNARGGELPSVTDAAIKLQEFGAQGITIHPRPDQRHITRRDVYDLKPLVHTEFNIEGNPHRAFIALVLEIKPEQVTLVPDGEDAITSNAGWDCENHLEFLKLVVAEFKDAGIRTSIFLDPNPEMVKYAKKTGADRIELYTEAYAINYSKNKEEAIKLAEAEDTDAFVIGGGKIYTEFLPYVDNLYLTEINAECPDADTYFPDFNKSDYIKEIKNFYDVDGTEFYHVIYKK